MRKARTEEEHLDQQRDVLQDAFGFTVDFSHDAKVLPRPILACVFLRGTKGCTKGCARLECWLVAEEWECLFPL